MLCMNIVKLLNNFKVHGRRFGEGCSDDSITITIANIGLYDMIKKGDNEGGDGGRQYSISVRNTS